MTTDRQLSEREHEILRLVATGASNQQIADQLTISVNTVKVHLRNIFGKLEVASRTEATLYAIRAGIAVVDEPPPADPDPELLAAPEDLPSTAAPSGQPHAVASAAPEDLPSAAAPYGRPHVVAPPLLIAALALLALLGGGVALALRGPAALTPASSAPTAQVLAQNSRWLPHPATPRPRADAAVVAYENQIFVIGGSDPAASARLDALNPDGSWTARAAAPEALTFAAAAAARGKIYLIGGEDVRGTPLASVAAYDPRADTWERLPPLPEPRSRAAAAAVEGVIYVFGGWDGSRYRADVWVYDPAARAWHKGRPMPTPRRAAGAAVIEGRVFVLGGENESGPLQANEVYRPNDGPDGSWELLLALRQPVAAPGVVSVTNVVKALIVIDPARRSVARFEPTSNTWTTIDVAASAVLARQAVTLDNSIFIIGGPDATPPGGVSEYQTLYTQYVPGLGPRETAGPSQP